jgi:hypothetical protein
MDMTRAPFIDSRNFDDVMNDIRELARSYLNNRWIYAATVDKSGEYNFSLNSYSLTAFGRVPAIDVLRSQDDIGISLSMIFVSFYLDIIARLNRLPTKNFIEFLNILGLKLSSPIASRVPVTFKQVDGAEGDIFIPKGILVAADANDKHDELILKQKRI